MECGCENQTSRTVKLSDAERTNLSAQIASYEKQGFEAFYSQDMSTAQKMFQIAIQQSGGQDLLETAQALEGLAFVQCEYKQFGPAEDNLKRAISIYEKQPGPRLKSELVRPLCQLGLIYGAENKIAEQKTVLTRAVQEGGTLGPTTYNGAYVGSLLGLGVLYKQEGQLLQAEALLRHALDLARIAPTPPRNYTSIVDNLADTLDKEGRRLDAAAIRANRVM
jgi:tetratricopeptide (TPR) repeat protein